MSSEFAVQRREVLAHAARPQSEDDQALDRVGAAESLLDARGGGADLRRFFACLYGGAPPEDITRYSAESLVALANLVFEQTAQRNPGETIVELLPFRVGDEQTARNETIFVGINDDMPFLFDSLIAELNAQDVRVRALFHPVLSVTRDQHGVRSDTGTKIGESVIVLALDAIPSDERCAAIAQGARRVFEQVKLAVRDWKQMVAHLRESIAALKARPPHVPAEIVDESVAFLEWLP